MGASNIKSYWTDAENVPWIPLEEGLSFKPLRFLPNMRGRVLLLRLEPGTEVPRHRHSGEVHGFNLQGTRQLHTGELVGPGDYVYEPAGNVDSWKAVGDTAVIVFITVRGAVEFLDANDQVVQRDTTESMRETYSAYCRANGIPEADLASFK